MCLSRVEGCWWTRDTVSAGGRASENCQACRLCSLCSSSAAEGRPQSDPTESFHLECELQPHCLCAKDSRRLLSPEDPLCSAPTVRQGRRLLLRSTGWAEAGTSIAHLRQLPAVASHAAITAMVAQPWSPTRANAMETRNADQRSAAHAAQPAHVGLARCTP
jgi:hypothetical protein